MSQSSTRARSPAQKMRRAERLLDAAARLEADHGFAAVRMADVARTAGVAKGTVFLYYPTKEALGLALLERLLAGWFDALDRALAGPDAPASPRGMARFLARSMADRPDLARMLALAGSVLEHNVDAGQARAFKRALLGRMRVAGVSLERVLPFLTRGDGLRVLLFLYVIVGGLHPMAEPSTAARAALADDDDLAPLRVDFAGGLESVLRVHMEGMRALRSPATGPATP